MPALYDAILRQQVYLEGVKYGAQRRLTAEMGVLFLAYITALRDLQVERLDELSKRELATLLARLRAVAIDIYGAYTVELFKFLRELTRIEAGMSALIIKEVGEDIARNVALNKFGRKFSDEMWASIQSTTVPATGDKFSELIDLYGIGVITALEKALRASYVSAETINEAVARLNGERSRFGTKGGIAAVSIGRGKGMVNTAVQHVVSVVSEKVQQSFYDHYLWISTIDKGTTDICRHRHEKRYKYGEGPLAPAHIGCRSRNVPETKSSGKHVGSFNTWLTEQPEEVQRFAASDKPVLTLDQYSKRIGSILK